MRTYGRTPDRYITLTARRGQRTSFESFSSVSPLRYATANSDNAVKQDGPSVSSNLKTYYWPAYT